MGVRFFFAVSKAVDRSIFIVPDCRNLVRQKGVRKGSSTFRHSNINFRLTRRCCICCFSIMASAVKRWPLATVSLSVTACDEQFVSKRKDILNSVVRCSTKLSKTRKSSGHRAAFWSMGVKACGGGFTSVSPGTCGLVSKSVSVLKGG